MLTPNDCSAPAPSMPASMIPGPAPVMTIQSCVGQRCREPPGLLVQRVVGLRRAPSRRSRPCARRGTARRRGTRSASPSGRRSRSSGRPGRRRSRASRTADAISSKTRSASWGAPISSTSSATRVVELGIAGAVPGELRHFVERIGASAGVRRPARPSDVAGRAPRWQMTSAAASAPSRPHSAEVVRRG